MEADKARLARNTKQKEGQGSSNKNTKRNRILVLSGNKTLSPPPSLFPGFCILVEPPRPPPYRRAKVTVRPSGWCATCASCTAPSAKSAQDSASDR